MVADRLDRRHQRHRQEQPRRAPHEIPEQARQHDRRGVQVHVPTHNQWHDQIAFQRDDDRINEQNAERVHRRKMHEGIEHRRNAGDDRADVRDVGQHAG